MRPNTGGAGANFGEHKAKIIAALDNCAGWFHRRAAGINLAYAWLNRAISRAAQPYFAGDRGDFNVGITS